MAWDPPPIGDDVALLLDLDGTLIDLAPTPDAVVVPPGLPGALLRLRARLGDALAVVTGRPIDQVDALLDAVPHGVAGEHGAAIRHGPGAEVERVAQPAIPRAWLARAEAAVAAFPGALLERKAHSFVLHFRQAPDASRALRALAQALVAESPAHAVMAAKMAWEVRPRGVDKGSAVTALMARPPFLGRRPIYVGDDITDEDGIRAARALGGLGLRVGGEFNDAAGVRAWLEREAGR